MNEIINEIQSKINSSIFLDFDMGNTTWFRVGGKTKAYVIVNSIKDLKTILTYSNQINYYIIGIAKISTPLCLRLYGRKKVSN